MSRLQGLPRFSSKSLRTCLKGDLVNERTQWKERFAVVASIALTAIAALAFGAGATIPSSGGVIRGCYTVGIGVVRLIDAEAGESCLPAVERAIAWSQTGPQGPAGPQGPTGPKGDPGLSGYEQITRSYTLQAGSGFGLTASCPAGKSVLGGGYQYIPASLTAPSISYDGPFGTVWRINGVNTTGVTITLNVFAVCAFAL